MVGKKNGAGYMHCYGMQSAVGPRLKVAAWLSRSALKDAPGRPGMMLIERNFNEIKVVQRKIRTIYEDTHRYCEKKMK